MNLQELVNTYFWIVYCLVTTIKIVKNFKLMEINLKSNIRDFELKFLQLISEFLN